MMFSPKCLELICFIRINYLKENIIELNALKEYFTRIFYRINVLNN